jgi:hypothetical protein
MLPTSTRHHRLHYIWLAATLLTLSTALTASTAALAQAQSTRGPYLGASIGGAGIDADIATGWAPAGGLLVGTRLTRRWDVEGDVVFPGRESTRTYGGGANDSPSLLVVPEGTPPAERDRYGIWMRHHNSRTVHAAMSGVVIFRLSLPEAPRLTLGLIGGLSAQRVTDRRDRTVTRVGPGVPANHHWIRDDSEVWPRTIGGPIIGAQLAVALTRHLSVVPDLRYHYGSLGDEINNLLQPSVRIAWRF